MIIELRRVSENLLYYAACLEENSGNTVFCSLSSPHVRAIIRSRRRRSHYFPEDLFADPAWDIMLDLLAAELEGKRVSVSSACIAAAVPATTALRWLKALTTAGIIERSNDRHDGRRVYVRLSREASQAMRAYFASLEYPANREIP